MARNVSFLISEDLIRQFSPISGNLDYEYLYPHILVAQDKWIQPKLGTKLYQELEDQIFNGTLTPDNELLLNDYIGKALVWWSFSIAFQFLAVKIVNSGVMQRIADDGNPISLDDARSLGAVSRDNAEWYTQRLIDYLCAYNQLYPAYSQADPADLRPEKANWSGGLNLGGGKPSAEGYSSGGGGTGGGSYTNPNPVKVGAGGIQPPQTFFAGGKTFEETMAQMFFPTTFPTFVAPSDTFIDDQPALLEIADVITINFVATFDQGQIILDAVFQNPRSGLPNAYKYTGASLPANVPSVLLTDNQQIVGYIVLQGVQNWGMIVDYDQGAQPLDSDGANYSTPLPAGSMPSINSEFEGVYPLFGTTVTIGTATKQALVSMINSNNNVFNMVAESGTDKQFFEIPDAWLVSRPLADVETFNTISSAWVGGGLADWTQSAVTETIQGNIINYTRFTYNGVNRGAIDIRLVF